MALPWINRVKAVLLAYLGGEGMGMAVARLLLGLESPCGKLAETWPLNLSERTLPPLFSGRTRDGGIPGKHLRRLPLL